MTVQELMILSNRHTDEEQQQADGLNFFNAGVALINSRLKTRLPRVESIQDNYEALSDTWVVSIIGNYLSWAMKMQDGSLSEADRYRVLFEQGIEDLREVMYGSEEDGSGGEIDLEYLDPNEVKKRFSRMKTNSFIPSWFDTDNR